MPSEAVGSEARTRADLTSKLDTSRTEADGEVGWAVRVVEREDAAVAECGLPATMALGVIYG